MITLYLFFFRVSFVLLLLVKDNMKLNFFNLTEKNKTMGHQAHRLYVKSILGNDFYSFADNCFLFIKILN